MAAVKAQWKTYGPLQHHARWIEEIEIRNYARHQMLREVHRIAELLRRGTNYAEPPEPLSNEHIADLRNDLALWEDPAAVRDLVTSGLSPFTKRTSGLIAEAIDRSWPR